MYIIVLYCEGLQELGAGKRFGLDKTVACTACSCLHTGRLLG